MASRTTSRAKKSAGPKASATAPSDEPNRFAPPTPNGAGGSRKRRPYRRDQILKVAIELFHERGYHATGIHDIGAAAGITGPAIYRHFKSKDEILETAVREYSELALEMVKRVVESDDPPQRVFERLVENLVELLLNDLPLAAVYVAERRMLAEPAQAQAERASRQYLEEWVHVVSRLRPDLADGEARLMAVAILSLGTSLTIYKSGVDRDRIAALMKSMIVGAVKGG